MAAVTAIFAEYPLEVADQAVFVIPRRTDRPTLRFISDVCDELYEPIERQLRRDRTAVDRRLALPRPPRTPAAQERIEAMIREARERLGIPPEGLPPRVVMFKPSADMPIKAPLPYDRNDGQHWRRVADDLERRHAHRMASSSAVCGNE